MPRIFPSTEAQNLLICVSGIGDKVAFSSLMTNVVPSLHMVDIDGSQCFPLYVYDEPTRRPR